MDHISKPLNNLKKKQECRAIINSAAATANQLPTTLQSDVLLAGIMQQQQEIIEVIKQQNENIQSILNLLKHRNEIAPLQGQEETKND